jgi:hypothetical protein
MEKVQLMADQSALQLFSLPVDSVVGDDAREYLCLRRREEINKVRRRVEVDDAASASLRSAVAAARIATLVAAVPPPATTTFVSVSPPVQAPSRPAFVLPAMTNPLEVESHSPDGTQIEYETRLAEDSPRFLDLNSEFFPCDV